MNNYPKARNEELVISELKNELLIYDLKINKAYCLNQTSALVWQWCNGQNSISEIGRLMSKKLKLEVPDELVWLALDSLKKEDLLENADVFEIGFGGFSRREAIKKVGLSSMIGLPLISSVIAPRAVHAQSSCVPQDQECAILEGPGNSNCCPQLACVVIEIPGGGTQNICVGGCIPGGNSCQNSPLTCCPGFECDTVTFFCLPSCNPAEDPNCPGPPA